MNFGVEQINDLYRLSNVDMTDFEAKVFEPGSWMVERLYLGKKVSWVATKRKISMNDFTDEAWVWLTIICSQVFPYPYDKSARIVVQDGCLHIRRHSHECWLACTLKYKGFQEP